MVNNIKKPKCLAGILVYLYDMLLENWKMPYSLCMKTAKKDRNQELSLPDKGAGYA
jgi:hypothetical protein